MHRIAPRLAAAAVISAALAASAAAQWNVSSTSGSSMFGARGVGSSNARFSNTGVANSAFGATRGSGTSSMMQGMTGRNTSMRQSSMGAMGASQFIGMDAQDMMNVMSQMGGPTAGGTTSWNRGGTTGRTSMGTGSTGRRQRQSQAQRGGQAASSPSSEVRTSLRVDFVYPRPVSSQLAAELARRLARSTTIQAAGPIAVSTQGSTVTLRGTVGTDHGRRLAERLVLLEPGVRQVRNELLVAPPEPAEPLEPEPEAAPSLDPPAME